MLQFTMIQFSFHQNGMPSNPYVRYHILVLFYYKAQSSITTMHEVLIQVLKHNYVKTRQIVKKTFRGPIEDIFDDFEEEHVASDSIAHVYLLNFFPHWCFFFKIFGDCKILNNHLCFSLAMFLVLNKVDILGSCANSSGCVEDTPQKWAPLVCCC